VIKLLELSQKSIRLRFDISDIDNCVDDPSVVLKESTKLDNTTECV
jgi:hypothetical protein